MKRLTAGVLTVLITSGFSSIASAEIASKSYVDVQNTAQTDTINTALAGKADQATTYTKTEVDTALTGKANTADLGALAAKDNIVTTDIVDANVTKAKLSTDVQASLDKADTSLQSADLAGYATTTALDAKADKTTTYTKTEVDTGLAAKADQATTYTKTEVDTALTGKADTATTLAGYGITDAMTSTDINTALGLKANTADLGTLATAAPGACSDPTNKCVLTFDGTTYSWEVVER
ncbi:MAG: hypothetical protein JW985_00175 [Alphaproteobacteria bacterium]|nr:hypothetical protein [Alphaproteobacteria bacterium]